jgi:hypothetical protein
MAYREVEHEDVSFVKFKNVGARFEGFYVKDEPGNYSKQDYHFLRVDGSVGVVSAGGSLKTQLEKAQLQKGFKVAIKLIRQEPTEHANPRNVFKVLVDDAPGPMPKAAAPAKPAAMPAPKADAFGDEEDEF